jgi:hypothetical protein
MALPFLKPGAHETWEGRGPVPTRHPQVHCPWGMGLPISTPSQVG